MPNHPTPGMIPFWFWNDGSSTDEKIAYLRTCHRAGIPGMIMHARSGNRIPYASDAWYRQIRDVVREGKKLGVQLWLYDEDPYPSGAAGGMVMTQYPDLAAQAMARRIAPTTLNTNDLWVIGPDRVLW
ncbi:MAG: hypothetical protein ACYTGH_14630, partial [Planctomycetota bacterium]